MSQGETLSFSMTQDQSSNHKVTGSNIMIFYDIRSEVKVHKATDGYKHGWYSMKQDEGSNETVTGPDKSYSMTHDHSLSHKVTEGQT